ncbi:MAG: hypothetical protein LBL90_04445 [Prevotellaceae bacterium]|nr:hypothetical protein [Prevotellaceae bacterium]
MAILGACPLHVIAQDSKKTTSQSQQSNYDNKKYSPNTKGGGYAGVVVDTVITLPDGSATGYFSFSFSSNDAEQDMNPVFFNNVWNLPPLGARRDFEETQEQILRQIDEDANRLNHWLNQQVALRNERVKQYWKEQKEILFIQIMELTPEEAKLFWPLYNEFSNKKDEISSKRQTINNKLRKASLYNINDKEADMFAKEHINLLTQENNLQQEYYRRFKAILKPSKLLMIYKAEDAFKLMMLQKRGQIE